MVLYHRTTAEIAEAIVATGFVDAEKTWGMELPKGARLRGVWLADRPLDAEDIGGTCEQDT